MAAIMSGPQCERQRQAIIWSHARILLIEPLVTNFKEI